MHIRTTPATRRAMALALGSLATLVAAAACSGADSPPRWARSNVRPSAALERVMREQAERGLMPREVIERFGLDVPVCDESFAALAAPTPAASRLDALRTQLTNLAPDHLANDRTGDASCSACSFRLLSQAETTIAALGGRLLAGWNDSKGFCPPNGAVQGYAWSVDDGITWTDGGDVPALPTGGRYRGDPVHAVNASSGRFYILGLCEGGTPGSGLALCWGRFAGGAFVFEGNRQIAQGMTEFLDKPWFAVDSISGNVYVSWTPFPNAGGDRIDFQAFDSLGIAISAVQTLSSPAGFGNVQGSRPVVGPDGELYVVWYEYGYPISHVRIRRSDDHGSTFGPQVNVADFYENSNSGAPGYRRAFAPTLPSIAVDRGNGPQRGRLYVTWDEAVDFYDAPLDSAGPPISSQENDGYFASATPFAVGSVLRGAMASTTDVDFFSFTGTRGQTLVVAGDSAATGTNLNLRLVCPSDTSTFNNYRLLAFSQSAYPMFAFTLPADGTYHLRLNSAVATVGAYRLLTAWDTPTPGERAHDHRDQAVAWSDGGTTWSPPLRLTDTDFADGIFAEVAVDGLGGVHTFWHDFRGDATCGAESYEYMVSSGDGGLTWGANRRMSDASSFWSFNACGSANQGDYQGITADGGTVYACWSDSRLGDPDVFMEAHAHALSASCPAPASAPGGGDATVHFALVSGATPESFTWRVEDTAGHVRGVSPAPPATFAGAGPHVLDVTLALSGDCWPAVDDTVRLIVESLDIPGRADTCATIVTCTATTAVDPGPAPVLALDAPRPNPTSGGAQVTFSLPRPGFVRLALYGVDGARVRTLMAGASGSGPRVVRWDGVDDHGRRVPAGKYWVRLDAAGRVLRRGITLVR